MSNLSDRHRHLARTAVMEALELLGSPERLSEYLDRSAEPSPDQDGDADDPTNDSVNQSILPTELRSALLDQLPLVTRSDPKIERWEWLYQADGTPVGGHQRNEPSAQEQESSEPLQKAIQLIADLQHLLHFPDSAAQAEKSRDWTDGPASIPRLVQCGLISGRPAWKKTQERLLAINDELISEKARTTAENYIIKFANMLTSRLSTLCAGLLLALGAGSVSKAETGSERLADGLSAIEYWLTEQFPSGWQQREARLVEILESFSELIGQNQNSNTQTDTRFSDALQNLIDRLPDLSITNIQSESSTLFKPLARSTRDSMIQKFQFVGWNELSKILERRTSRTAKSSPLLQASQIVCQCGDVLPGMLFQPRLRDMSIGDWSQIAYLATTLERRTRSASRQPNMLTCPLWVGLQALLQLGFDSQLTGYIRDVLQDRWEQENSEWQTQALQFAADLSIQSPEILMASQFDRKRKSSSKPVQLSVIIGHPQRFPAGMANLSPNQKHPLLCLPEKELLDVLRLFKRHPANLKLHALFIEEPPTDFDPSRIMKDFNAFLEGDTPIVGVFDNPPNDSNFAWLTRTPNSLNGLFARIDEL